RPGVRQRAADAQRHLRPGGACVRGRPRARPTDRLHRPRSRLGAVSYDVVVLGLGGMGSAAAAHLAARGHRVLGLERFGPAHDQGSSHGGSRIIRQSYFEDPAYVPLLMRAYELWDQLERDAGAELLTRTGGLYFGAPDLPTVSGSLLAAREWDLPHEVLDADEIR